MAADPADVYPSLDLALRVGEVLLNSGAGASDVAGAMLDVTRACGVRRVSADVTFVDLSLHHQPSADQPAATQVRRVIRRPVDYHQLTRVEELMQDLVDERVDVAEARARMARIVSGGRYRPRWAATLGLGVMGAGVALTFGGDIVVCALAFLAACAIDRTKVRLAGEALPPFYQQVAGGLIASGIAVAASATPLDVNPSRVVTAGIVVLLAGVGLVGAMQDAIMSFPVTASARLVDAVLATVGIIAGVAGGLALSGLLNVDLVNYKPGAVGFADNATAVAGAGLAAAAYAYSCYAPMRAVAVVAGVAAVAKALATVFSGGDLGAPWGAAVAATAIGLASYLVSGRVRVPPLAVVVPSIAPLLPGLAIYRGLALLAEGKDGVSELATAAMTAVALASGVILGHYLAQPMRQEARRLGSRIARPRLVGPRIRRGGHRRPAEEQ
ncbi:MULTISPECIES: threonine/serine ThrE exporter family protein [unclassified Nocardioides]|uniref:threonine/serine ThrE exporter family protein n=1 Tax=unclassified Nocardioides TaxID=2615069 RepID=UPI00360F2655